jgi:hypothetical protein
MHVRFMAKCRYRLRYGPIKPGSSSQTPIAVANARYSRSQRGATRSNEGHRKTAGGSGRRWKAAGSGGERRKKVKSRYIDAGVHIGVYAHGHGGCHGTGRSIVPRFPSKYRFASRHTTTADVQMDYDGGAEVQLQRRGRYTIATRAQMDDDGGRKCTITAERQVHDHG